MKIGILQTGHAPDELLPKHGDYADMFERLLAGRGLAFETWSVVDGVFPADFASADGWLITGSKHGVYEDHAWIPPLEEFLRQAFAAGVPIVGVCFGHQILAQALGGRVEKFPGGWRVGVQSYDLDGMGEKVPINAFHQDQVVTPPAGAEVVGYSPFCRYAALAYGDKAYSIQPHPEFDAPFMADLIAARGAILPEDVAKGAAESLSEPIAADTVATHFAQFFDRSRLAKAG